MFTANRLRAFLAVAAMLGTVTAALEGRTRKGDKLLSQGRLAEQKKQWDEALDLYEQALSEDPGDAAYQLAARRVRFQAGQFHVDEGQKLRAKGQLIEALGEFEKAYAIDPASSIAEQEIHRTRAMIEREKKKPKVDGETGKLDDDTRGLTPAQVARKEFDDKASTILPIPELKPLNPQPITLKMNNQPPKILFETVGKLAGINVLFDPEYANTAKNQSIEFNGSTLEEALNYLEVVTKSFWKPLSANTIFVTNDNTTKRRDYEEQVMKVFYLTNVTSPQELQEIVTAVRSVADLQRLFTYNAQNAIIARGEADRIALAEKIISDLDKPRPEVVVDVIVMEANKVKTRNLAAAVAPSGINIPISYNPRASVRTLTSGSDGTGTGTTTGTNGGTTTPTTPTTPSTNSTAIPLSNLGKISTRDFSVTLPGGLVEALMTDRSTRVLQSPQVRAVDNQKASLRIGDKVPTATGSFQPGIGGVGINPLVNTQFNFIDVGVNVDITPKIHGSDEVSLHIEVEISNVRDRIDLGGISQPVIGQRKVIHDIRMKEGEVNLLGGLMQTQETKSVSGVPGLSSIPVIRRLFTSENLEKNESELLIALVPHIVRSPELTGTNLKGIAVGNATVVKLNYAPRKAPVAPPAASGTMSPVAHDTAPPPTAPPPTAPPPTPAPATPAPTAPATPQNTPRALFAPAQITAQLSSPIIVNLMVENAADLFAAPLQVRFDPKILRVNDLVAGNALSSDGQQLLFTKNILNESGIAAVNLSRPPGTPGVNASGALLTLTFQAIGRGSTKVTVPSLTLQNSQGLSILTMTVDLPVTIQ